MARLKQTLFRPGATQNMRLHMGMGIHAKSEASAKRFPTRRLAAPLSVAECVLTNVNLGKTHSTKCVCVCVCVRACVRACVRTCVRAYVRTCVRACGTAKCPDAALICKDIIA